MNQTQNAKTIKMIAFNPMTRKNEEVFPEDEVAVSEMTPMFRSGNFGWVTVPGYEAADVYAEWAAQVR